MLVLLLSNPLRFNNQKFLKLLSLPDQKKALDIHNRIVQAQFIGGRLLLKECLHRTNNDKLLNAKIVISKSGKPQLSHSKIKFNISHTDKLIACAIGSQDMGIDIEAINRRTILPKNTTLKQWVWLEACSKLTGKGLTQIQNHLDASKFKHFESRILNHYLAIATRNRDEIKISKINRLTFV